ncbi:hypothetical protein GCK32_002407 [Trichostrongylus colubriformis]|uniref:Uncharacterized protein n=1 Tax=Trichostrongylus colubriformis TaxID=6319 RepID=A0AAN8IIG4_TRICO
MHSTRRRSKGPSPDENQEPENKSEEATTERLQGGRTRVDLHKYIYLFQEVAVAESEQSGYLASTAALDQLRNMCFSGRAHEGTADDDDQGRDVREDLIADRSLAARDPVAPDEEGEDRAHDLEEAVADLTRGLVQEEAADHAGVDPGEATNRAGERQLEIVVATRREDS